MSANYFRAMGEYFGYPECCIDNFVSRNRYVTKDSIFLGSGFIPCCECDSKTKGLNIENACKVIGITNPFKRHEYRGTMLGWYETIKVSPRFKLLSIKYNLKE